MTLGAIAASSALLGSTTSQAVAAPEGIHKIEHVVIIMQVNRSFDSYFGTYPGANGIPRGVCLPNPSTGGCDRPYHEANDKNFGGPHGEVAAHRDINNGAMDGFVATRVGGESNCKPNDPKCSPCEPSPSAQNCNDVMGYHDAREIPNYWQYAQSFVLQDNLFQSAASWSLPEHLFLVSGWASMCPPGGSNPLDCSGTTPLRPPDARTTFAWTDITSQLFKAHVSWRYYVSEGAQPDCESDEALSCGKVHQSAKTPGIWNPLPNFTDVKQDGELGNVQALPQLYNAVQANSNCGLPNVSWVAPNGGHSEHPPGLVSAGQTYVTTMVNAIMRSHCWGSTAIFLSWDDWGGFYDHVRPPNMDANGYGLRVPGLVISPYAKTGYVDHQQLSHDAYLKFIEDDFLGGARLNPKTDGRPDLRPDVREEAPGLGDLANDFNFSQQPRPPLLLAAHPAPGPASEPPGGPSQVPTVSGNPPSSVTRTSATLNGTVNPNGGNVSECVFEYGTSVFYGSSAQCVPAPGMGSGPLAVSATISGLSAGTAYHFRLVAANASGTSSSRDQVFSTLAEPPVVTSVTPGAGLERGGTSVRIEGNGLRWVTAVNFGATPATSFTVNSDGSITATSPQGPGVVDVTVTSSGGTSAPTTSDRFSNVRPGPPPTIESISPGGGPAAGGTAVAISGTGFDGVTAVGFGTAPASSFEASSNTSLNALSPPTAAGTVHLTVTTPNGTSAFSAKDRFHVGPPTITSVRPNAGPAAGGISVTVNGSGFELGTGRMTARFGSVQATGVECSTSTSCQFVAPSHKAGTVHIRVTAGGERSGEGLADQFTYE